MIHLLLAIYQEEPTVFITIYMSPPRTLTQVKVILLHRNPNHVESYHSMVFL